MFGPSAMNAISSNPYLLCGEPLQLDFRHADSIAQYYHMEGDCTQRLEAALLRTLRHNAGNGHTCLPRAQLLETASNFIHQPPEKLAAMLSARERMSSVTRDERLLAAAPDNAETFENQILWRDALRSLGRPYGQVLWMRFFGGLSQQEIAGRFGVSQTQVSRWEKEGRQLLRESFGENGETSPVSLEKARRS